MSDDMSMFKKMKERISDEVNSATNRLQTMQIMDHLSTNLGGQKTSNHDDRSGVSCEPTPNITLPELGDLIGDSTNVPLVTSASTSHPRDKELNLVNDKIEICAEYEGELNSTFSPQHQLFDGGSILRLQADHSGQADCFKLADFHSDIDDDAEVDHLTDQQESLTNSSELISKKLANYKTRYRSLIHAMRKLESDKNRERDELVKQTRNLHGQVDSLKNELDRASSIQPTRMVQSTISASSSQPDDIDALVTADGRSSPQQSSLVVSNHKQTRKIKDLEKLIAKCKDSLKAKNAQLQILKKSILEIDKFKTMMETMKGDLFELKQSYEVWTIKIAENKQIMHQEIEDKISEMERYKSEMKDLESQMIEQSNTTAQLKSTIQNLESRLVSTSAAHQKERESLIKELNSGKSNALKQQKKEFELQVERVKLDLEKSIESLKSDLLIKDEQIMRGAEREHKIHSQNQATLKELTEIGADLRIAVKDIKNLKEIEKNQEEEIEKLKTDLEKFSNDDSQVIIQNLKDDLETSRNELKQAHEEMDRSRELLQQLNIEHENSQKEQGNKINELSSENGKLLEEVKLLKGSYENYEKENKELREHLRSANEKATDLATCKDCANLRDESAKIAETYEQRLHDLNGQLTLMRTANSDQEKAITELERNNENSMISVQSLRHELEESGKKNESLLQVIQDNEAELQQQQNQIDRLTSLKQEVETFKKDNSTLTSSLNQVKQELAERNSDISQSKQECEVAGARVVELEERLKDRLNSFESMRLERDSLRSELAECSKKQNDVNEKLIVSILAAIKNLETPDTSPGSDKTLGKSAQHESEDNGDWSPDEHSESSLKRVDSDPLRLAKELSSLALGRSNAYMTVAQRLQASILDNKIMSEELLRLRDEINSLNQEKSKEVQCSLDEIERLKTENQALIHDQKVYDDQVASYEIEIETLSRQIKDLEQARERTKDEQADKCPETIDASVGIQVDEDHEDLRARYEELDELLKSREAEISDLKSIISEHKTIIAQQAIPLEQNNDQPQATDDYVPDSTEFEYLKNIVFQFMVGREPLTLARVISAVLKFDKSQVDQICKTQEAIHQVSG